MFYTAAGRNPAAVFTWVPEHLLAEWRFFNVLANMPVLDGLVEELIKKGLLVPPEDGIGAEGCWMSVAR